jgi:NAD-dependent SIR2 family protein deacetylase
MPKSLDMLSAPAIERSPQLRGSTSTLVCLSCGDTATHAQTIPRLGVRPELRVFVCPSCKGVETRALK